GSGEVLVAGRCSSGNELSLAVASAATLAAAVEELHRLRNDFDLRALRPILGFPRGPVEAAVDSYASSLREMHVQGVSLVAEHLDVEEIGLVDPVPGVVLLATVHCDSELEDSGTRWEVSQLGVTCQTSHD